MKTSAKTKAPRKPAKRGGKSKASKPALTLRQLTSPEAVAAASELFDVVVCVGVDASGQYMILTNTADNAHSIAMLECGKTLLIEGVMG